MNTNDQIAFVGVLDCKVEGCDAPRARSSAKCLFHALQARAANKAAKVAAPKQVIASYADVTGDRDLVIPGVTKSSPKAAVIQDANWVDRSPAKSSSMKAAYAALAAAEDRLALVDKEDADAHAAGVAEVVAAHAEIGRIAQAK